MPKKAASKKKASSKGPSKRSTAASQPQFSAEQSVGSVSSAQHSDVADQEASAAGDGSSRGSDAGLVARVEVAPSRTFPVYAGPRPDEELLQVVREEVHAGDEASVEYVYHLLRADEDVNQRSVSGLTPLTVATAAANGPLVSLLLERRADATLRSVHLAELPIHYAARGGNRVVCQLLAEPTSAAGLIDAPNSTGWPPLHLAAVAGHFSVLRVLMKYGANICGRNELSGGGTTLHIAARLGFMELAETLLDHDAEVDAADALGRGPLHFAAARGDYTCCSLLLRSRADPASQGPGNRSPLDLLPRECEGRERVANLLAAYARPAPQALRTDLRFDRHDPRDSDAL